MVNYYTCSFDDLKVNYLDILEFGLYHNESLPEGLQDVADALTPKFVMMSGILFAFTLGCSLVFLRHENILMGIDWVRSKPILGLAGKQRPPLTGTQVLRPRILI